MNVAMKLTQRRLRLRGRRKLGIAFASHFGPQGSRPRVQMRVLSGMGALLAVHSSINEKQLRGQIPTMTDEPARSFIQYTENPLA